MSEEIDKIIEERAAAYGDYRGGTKLRANIMDAINLRHTEVHGVPLDAVSYVRIFDIVNKLSRIAATPLHFDSWHDIVGYGKRIVSDVGEDNSSTQKSLNPGI